MSLNVRDILDAVSSHALATGYFDRTNLHEPKNAPGNGISCSIWFQEAEAIRGSGLNSTSVRVSLTVRVQTSMVSEPADAIDTNLVEAFDALMTAYNGDFTLDDLLRNIDVLGAYGAPLRATGGYVEQDKKIYRLFDITLPLIVNDVWDQNA